MGSSKKHKEKDRERRDGEGKSKKRKHRSRSKSRSPGKEKKRRHRDRKSKSRSRSPIPQASDRREYDRNVSPIDADEEYLYGKSDQATARHGEDRRSEVQVFDYGHKNIDPHSEKAPKQIKENVNMSDVREHQSSGDGSSLSIEETNRLRMKLGLKPLDLPDSKSSSGQAKKTANTVHRPAVNMAEQRTTEKLKEKMANRKSQREIHSRLGKIKGLGESDSEDEDARAWVKKNRKLQAQREMAEKRAKMLEEMDEDFGISSLVDQDFKTGSKNNYTSQDLSGLRVEHDIERFEEGRNVVLTLKDKGILDEDDDDDVLVNVNIEDDERADKNVDNKKKKPNYTPYDQPELDEYGMMKPSNMLEKYDEEIDGAKKESFTLGARGSYDARHEKRMQEIRNELRAKGESLLTPKLSLATDYKTVEEVKAAAAFKKPKKKIRKIRKKDILKADDLLPLPDEVSSSGDYGSRSRGRGRLDIKSEDGEITEDSIGHQAMDTEAAFSTDMTVIPKIEVKSQPSAENEEEDLTGVALEEEQAQLELQATLAKARKLKLKKERKSALESLSAVNIKPDVDTTAASNITLNSISEFCRGLGEIPTYGLSGNREEERDEIMDQELELLEQKRREAEEEETTGGWAEVDVDVTPVDVQMEEAAILEDEPISTDGIGAALKLAQKKGFLEDDGSKKNTGLSAKAQEMLAKAYTIQDKNYNDLDEKNRKRDRYSGGMTTEFKEKTHYKPEVVLDYVDDSGRSLSQKEAFRQLSHRFHGKGSGKKKTEKRGKKVEEELLMKRMSSTDTPLNTLSLLQDKQRAEQSPYVLLSGSKGFTSNTISKPV